MLYVFNNSRIFKLLSTLHANHGECEDGVGICRCGVTYGEEPGVGGSEQRQYGDVYGIMSFFGAGMKLVRDCSGSQGGGGVF